MAKKQKLRPVVLVRMPDDMKRFVEQQAASMFDSQSAEVCRAIKERMDRIKKAEAKEHAGA